MSSREQYSDLKNIGIKADLKLFAAAADRKLK
jgi:hypothetical protein